MYEKIKFKEKHKNCINTEKHDCDLLVEWVTSSNCIVATKIKNFVVMQNLIIMQDKINFRFSFNEASCILNLLNYVRFSCWQSKVHHNSPGTQETSSTLPMKKKVINKQCRGCEKINVKGNRKGKQSGNYITWHPIVFLPQWTSDSELRCQKCKLNGSFPCHSFHTIWSSQQQSHHTFYSFDGNQNWMN